MDTYYGAWKLRYPTLLIEVKLDVCKVLRVWLSIIHKAREETAHLQQ
jgi:hypothetical protein